MASSQVRSQGNGANGSSRTLVSKRFSDIPLSLDIPVQDQDDQDVEIDLSNLADDPSELCQLLEVENATRHYWMMFGLAYAKLRKVDCAIEMLIRGSQALAPNNTREKLSIVTALCCMYLYKSREAPRLQPRSGDEVKTKEYYLQQATSSLNEALKINPSFPPLYLARGVLLLLRASLQPASKANPKVPNAVDVERNELLRQALKLFEDAIRVSGGKNMFAVMGKARTLYSMGKYAEALSGYQEVLSRMSDLVDPDPRIGIGCCFWQLGFKEDAKLAWERCLEINPTSKIANILLGLFYLDSSSHVPINSPEFIALYKKAMIEYAQTSFKLDKNLPLTCVTFANYFLSNKKLDNTETLAHKAIEFTDVNAISGDGWYLLARKAHLSDDLAAASDYYRRSDDARGGTDRGYLPAKLGLAQLMVVKGQMSEAKLALEKIIQQSKSYEAMVLLGTIYAEEVFANQSAAVKEDKSAEEKKAVSLLEQVRAAWKDPKKGLSADAAVLLNLARLYESESHDKALQCLEQVQELEITQIPEAERPSAMTDDNAKRDALGKLLPPQLLNNTGCFYSQAEKHELASQMFEAALGACMRIDQADTEVDTDALVTTISFNLGRSYESRGMPDQAAEVYESLLKRHEDYVDARARLAYIQIRKNPKEGHEAMNQLYQDNSSNIEVRSLHGWYLGRKKRPGTNVNEDPELRQYKHTLQNHDKHDRYALVGMGNIYLVSAREMRRETESDRQKRSAVYSRAVEFFDKALLLDPKNAYAAQGIAIALIEDKKDYKTALQILIKMRDTIKNADIYMNLGHVYSELRQYSKAIESYEAALAKEGKSNDAIIISCMAKTWLNRGRSERNLDAYKTALEWAQKALTIQPDQAHFKFNVAFVQIQLAMMLHSLSENNRNSFQLEEASKGLEEAIKTLEEIAAHPTPPYPKHDLEQRANMARNTQRRQLERALASQKEYEAKNKEKHAAAMEQRQAELRRREELRQKAEEEERARQERIRKEREIIAAKDRELAEKRAEEERARQEAEMTTDSETGNKIKRKKRAAGGARNSPRSSQSPAPERVKKPKAQGAGRSRKKKAAADDDEDSDAAEARPKKKQRLTRGKESAKYKSAEVVIDSDEDEDELDRADREIERSRKAGTPGSGSESEGGGGGRRRRRGGDDEDSDRMDVDEDGEEAGNAGAAGADDEDEDEAVGRRRPNRARKGRIVEESDEEEEGEEAPAKGADDEDEE